MYTSILAFALLLLLATLYVSLPIHSRRRITFYDPLSVELKQHKTYQSSNTITHVSNPIFKTFETVSTKPLLNKSFIIDLEASNNGTNTTASSFTSTKTFVLGIFSTQREVKGRKLIRETMLQSNIGLPKYKLCTLQDYMSSKSVQTRCQIIYTFVVGGNCIVEDGDVNDKKTRWKSTSTKPRNATVEPPAKLLKLESDITYLNIQENANEDKSLSWFDYISSMGKQFDYIGKSDMHTYIHMDKLLDIINGRLPSANRNLYAGGMKEIYRRNTPQKSSSPTDTPLYMQGPFYFMSRRLARCITTRVVGTNKIGRPEDAQVGYLVNSCPEPVEWLICSWVPSSGLRPTKAHQRIIPNLVRYFWSKSDNDWMDYSQRTQTNHTASAPSIVGNVCQGQDVLEGFANHMQFHWENSKVK